MADESEINWNNDSEGRKGQYFLQFSKLESKAQSLISRLESQRNAIQKLEIESREQIATAQKNAYSALEGVVDLLLTVNDGNTRLYRGNTLIVAALAESVQRFSELSDVARDNMRELGTRAGSCMSMGDEADRFIRTLREHYRALETDSKAIKPIMDGRQDEYNDLRERESRLRSDVDNARSSQDDAGNAFLGFFDNSVTDRLARNVQNAMERLNDNLQRQATKRRGYEALYECICVARLAAAATLSLKARTTSVSDDFDTAFNSVTETQEIETELWKGLMSLENKVCDPDYRTTRDNSLRIIFQLLTADDLVFSAGSYAARVENSIKASVRSKIGAEALEKLLAPAARTSNEDFKL